MQSARHNSSAHQAAGHWRKSVSALLVLLAIKVYANFFFFNNN